MMSLLAFLLLIFGSLGAGSIVLHLSGARKFFTLGEDAAISLTLGIGMIGWFAFFPGIIGYFSNPALFLITLLPCIGLIPLWSRYQSNIGDFSYPPFTITEKFLTFGLMIILSFDLLEACFQQVKGKNDHQPKSQKLFSYGEGWVRKITNIRLVARP